MIEHIDCDFDMNEKAMQQKIDYMAKYFVQATLEFIDKIDEIINEAEDLNDFPFEIDDLIERVAQESEELNEIVSFYEIMTGK